MPIEMLLGFTANISKETQIQQKDVYKRQLQLRGVRPFLSNKYDITKHPKYRQLSDYNKRNAFDIEKYRQHKLVAVSYTHLDVYKRQDMGGAMQRQVC